uniref:DUF4216 domain-containing protein n=1 Tax=Opuntia streptacantha TaxID=393608 RepID=A0A7C9ERB5_OPUST
MPPGGPRVQKNSSASASDYENRPGGSSVDLCDWFKIRIANLWKEGDDRVSEELFCLAQGPLKCVICYEGYIINGFRFHTRKRQRKRKTQNSGVVVKGDVESGEADFYGVLDEVILLEYNALKDRRSPKVVLFKCKWFDIYNKVNGVKVDKFGVTSVNVSRRLPINEPFALGCQVGQVFYVPTHNTPQWRVVVKTTPRNHFDFPADEDDHYGNVILQDIVQEEVINILQDIQEVNNEDIPLVRDDIEPDLVEAMLANQSKRLLIVDLLMSTKQRGDG